MPLCRRCDADLLHEGHRLGCPNAEDDAATIARLRRERDWFARERDEAKDTLGERTRVLAAAEAERDEWKKAHAAEMKGHAESAVVGVRYRDERDEAERAQATTRLVQDDYEKLAAEVRDAKQHIRFYLDDPGECPEGLVPLLWLISCVNGVVAEARDGLKAEKQHVERLRAEVERLRGQSEGARRIAAERARQMGAEGWTPEHDDAHRFADLAVHAAALAVYGTDAAVVDPLGRGSIGSREDDHWDDWGLQEQHGDDRLRSLEIAGALIAAELDRELRAALAEGQDEEGDDG